MHGWRILWIVVPYATVILVLLMALWRTETAATDAKQHVKTLTAWQENTKAANRALTDENLALRDEIEDHEAQRAVWEERHAERIDERDAALRKAKVAERLHDSITEFTWELIVIGDQLAASKGRPLYALRQTWATMTAPARIDDTEDQA